MQNISIILREARESKGLTIKEVAKALKLRERHIHMLEDGKLSELSSEIYLKGFLKTYTSWLNIDGSDVIGQINHEKKRTLPPRNNSVPIIAIGFSYVSALARRPGLKFFLLSAILTFSIYILWSGQHKNSVEVDMVSSLQQTSSLNEKYSNILEEYRDKDLVFFPKANVEIKITDTSTGEEKTTNLSDGDVFFIKSDEKTVITTSSPDSIEVLLDNGETQEPIGTLDNILMKF